MKKYPRKRKIDSGLRWGQGSVEVRGDRYLARWLDASGRKRSRTFRTLDDAEEHVRQQARLRAVQRWVEPSERTVRDLIDAWLDRGRDRWTPNTHATYRLRAESHVLPALGDVLAGELTTPRVQHWIDALRRQGLAPSTIGGAAIVLSAACNEAVALGVLSRNPCHGTRKPAVNPKPRAVWTLATVQEVLHHLADQPMWQALYALALTSGMRPGELRALTWADIAPQTRQIRVRRTITRDMEYRVIVGAQTKTGRSRTVAVPASVIAMLQRWKAEQPVVHVEGYVFCRADGNWLPVTTWQRFHDHLIAELHLPRITIHGMRHTAATLDLERGVPIKLVQEKLGHRSISTTMDVYAQVSDRMQHDAADELDGLIFGEISTRLSTGKPNS